MSINKAILIGNVGSINSRSFSNGGKVVNMTIATTEKGYTLQNGTQVPERTDWHNLVYTGYTAGFAEKYIHKGDKIYVEGKLRNRTYEDKDKIKRYVTEILVERVEFCGGKRTEQTQSEPAPPEQNLGDPMFPENVDPFERKDDLPF